VDLKQAWQTSSKTVHRRWDYCGVELSRMLELELSFFSGWTDETWMNKAVRMVADQDHRAAIPNTLTAWFAGFVERACA
jgi:hypothetical protein